MKQFILLIICLLLSIYAAAQVPVAIDATITTIPSTAGATAIAALTATDADGTIASYTISTLPTHGTLAVGGTAATAGQGLSLTDAANLEYDPAGDFTGNDTFTFTATDNLGTISNIATITIPIGNNPPTANSATISSIPSTAGATAIATLTATDTDGTIASYTISTLPTHGTLAVGGNAATAGQGLSLTDAANLKYDPSGTFTGNDSFTFTATDNNGAASSSATITIPIGNNPPTANSATISSIPSTAGATAIAALTATDTDGTIASYTISTLPTHGTLTVGGNAATAGQALTPTQAATLTYDPDGNFTGNDSFTFTATDNNGAASSSATITIPIGNNPPTANSATISSIPSTAGATAIAALTATDTDGTIASYTISTLPTHGTLAVGGTSATAGQTLTPVQAATLTYDPAGNFTGNDSFTFTATDNSGATDPTPATITIPVGNNPPTANNATTATIPSTAGATAIAALTATDTDGTIASYTISSLPTHGTLAVGGNAATAGQVLTPAQAATLTYDPAGNFTGNDSFTFTSTDNSGATDPTPATITIPVGNNPPTANSATTSSIPSTEGATAIAALTATDTDGTIASYIISTLPTHGALAVGGNAATAGQVLTPAQAATLTYDPAGNFTGNDSFTFTATDNNGATSSSSTITISVGNNPPTANDATNATIPSTAGATAIATLTATDTDGTIVSYTILSLPSHGILYVGGIPVSTGQVLSPLQVTALSYDPNGLFIGNDIFTFTATDNNGAVDATPATITIPVGNNPPTANSATVSSIPSTAGATAIAALTATDTDGTIASYTISTLPTHGILAVGGTAATAGQVLTPAQAATLTYDPAGNFTGNDSFTFTATDNSGAPDPTPATITISVSNNPPTANSATTATIPSTAGATTIAALTATDTDGIIASYTVLTLPLHGTLYVGGSAVAAVQVLTPAQAATLTYDPNGNFTGNDTFTFTAKDNNGAASTPAVITIPIGNNPPTANDVTNATIPSTAGATAISPLTATDTDGTITSYTILTLPLHGVLYVGGIAASAGQILTPLQTNSLSYDPSGIFIGNDTFTFTATDNSGAVDATPATITIPVGNNPPTANSATILSIPSTAGATTIAALTATDTDGTIASYTISTLPTHGTLAVGGTAATAGQSLTPTQAATLTYDPAGNFTGNDTFTFTATDNLGAISNTAAITIPIGNNPPTANNATTVTIPSTAGATAIAALTATDTDGIIASYTILTLPTHGALSVGGVAATAGEVLTPIQATTLTYTPIGNYTGNDSFIFTVTDNNGAIDTTPATISIPVGNTPPVANPDTKTTNEDTPVSFSVTANDTDIDGTVDVATVDLDPTTAGRQTTFTVAGQGTYTADNLGTVTFTPVANYNGTTTPVSYTVNDNSGSPSNVSTITVTVIPVNDPPVANPDTKTTNEDTPVSFNVTANDTDIDGTVDVATVDLDPATAGRQTTFTVAGQGTYTADNLGTVTFTPVANYNGTATPINYTVNDNNGATSNISTITVTVTPVNDPPVANPDTKTTNEDTPVSFNVTTNDTDIDGTVDVATVDLDPATAGRQTTFTVAGQGTYTVDNLGIVTFTPVANYNGTATPINYTVNDNSGATSNIATITVTVTSVNDPPVANPDTKTTNEDTAVSFNVTANDTDVDGTVDVATVDLDPATAGQQTTFTVAGQGTYTVDNLGMVTFTPVKNYNGTSTPVNYTVNDNSGATSNISTITVTVTPINDAPVTVDDLAGTSQNTTVTISVLANDSFGKNGPSTGSITATDGAHGTVTINNGGTPNDPTDDKVVYTPNSGYSGADAFTYTICNSKGLCSTANVTVSIAPLSNMLTANMHATKPVMNPDGATFSWSYVITLTNKQNQLIDSIRIADYLSSVFDVNPKPSFSISKISVSGNTLKANSAYNGTTVTGLLSDRSYLNANSSDSIILEISVNPNGYAGKLSNIAYVDGVTATGTIKGAPTDDSGLPGSADPATTALPGVELTIPDGFTPNGDGFNEKFVIVHPDSLKLKIVVFNRWGNQVYSNNNYQNDWNGKGSGGNDLATGTYFVEIYATNASTGEMVRKELKYITLLR